MSEFLRVDYLRLILLYIILALIFAFVGLFQEIKLKNRIKINYHNYEIYKQYFKLKINLIYVLSFIIYLITSTVIAIIIVRDNVYGTYALILPVLNILLFPFVYLHLTRIKYNLDLTIFTMYFQKIKSNYYNKLLLSQQLQKVEKTYNDLHNECININNLLKDYFLDFKGIDSLETTLLPLTDIIKTHQDELANFDDSYPDKFDKALNFYLNSQVHSKLDIKEFAYIANYSLPKLVDSIKKAQILSLYNYSLKNIIDNNIYTTSLKELIKALLALNVTLDDKFITEVFNYLDKNIEDKTLLLSDIAKNKLITLNVLCECVNVKDLAWVYEDVVIDNLDKKDYVKIFTSMIINDAYDSAKKILSKLDNRVSVYITKALDRELKDNNTYKLFALYKKIYTTANFFNLKAVKYENLALVIDNFFKEYFPRDVEAPLINDIIQKRTFIHYRDKIEAIYKRIKTGYHKLLTSTMNTIIIYSKSKCTNLSYINYEKVITQYAHYRKNLNLNELKVLDELLLALILLNEDDEAIIDETYKTLYHNVSYNLSSITLSYDNRENVGKYIINFLKNNKLNILKTVVYSIENDRLVLDKLINM